MSDARLTTRASASPDATVFHSGILRRCFQEVLHHELDHSTHRHTPPPVPASCAGVEPDFHREGAKSSADVVFLDLEDAVATSEKATARRNVVAALNDLDRGIKTVQVRVNGLDTEYMYRDVIEVVESCPRLDMLLLPKIGVAADVYAVDTLVTQIELARQRSKKIGFDLLIETALGMSNVEAIAASSRRIKALSFGVGDYAASTRARSTVVGGQKPGLWRFGWKRRPA